DFYTGLFATSLAADELLVEVELPEREAGTGLGFEEFSRRRGDYGLAGVAAAVRLSPAGHVASARAVLLGVGEGPVVAASVAVALEGERPDPERLAAAAAAAASDDVEPAGDIHATAAYRRHLVAVLTRRALTAAVADAAADLDRQGEAP
ncbi:MAG: xanthine dehydrogenase family protein subunit M, partial [Thermoanaerobaculia bacterium]|nr:xanthine dehydrogenase family protein subunit M [Thermoanaerobaculia bacterium]